MTSHEDYPAFYKHLLQLLLGGCLLTFLACAVWMFVSGSRTGVQANGILAIWGLLNALGITLIQRRDKIGLWILVGVNLSTSGILWIRHHEWVEEASATIGEEYLLMSVAPIVCMLACAPLFIFRCMPSDKIIWKCMKGGWDIKHCRHIYQLTGGLIIAMVAIISVYHPSSPSAAEMPAAHLTAQKQGIPDEVEISYTFLDSASVTLKQITVIESMLDSIPEAERALYNRRAYALKHTLLSGLMSDNHNPTNLKNIFKIHSGDFSEAQQEIVDWYLALTEDEKKVWLACPAVDDFMSFEKEMKQRLSVTER